MSKPEHAWLTTHHTTIPCHEGVAAGEDQIFAPPGKVLEVCVIAERVFLSLCDYREGNQETTVTKTAEAHVDAMALLNALIAQMGIGRVRLALPWEVAR